MSRVEIGPCTLILGDCLSVLPALNVQPDAIVTDPPFGMGYVSRHNSGRGDCDMIRKDGNFAPIIGDDRPFDPSPWLDYPLVVLWGAQHYAERLPSRRGWLVWDKLAGKTPCDQSDCELAWTNRNAPVRIKTHLWRGIMRAGEENVVHSGKLHPNQKPVAIMKWSMEAVGVPEEATVLDPYMGSASTLVACLRTGRRSIGIEIDPAHFAVACDRVRKAWAEESSLVLFNGESS